MDCKAVHSVGRVADWPIAGLYTVSRRREQSAGNGESLFRILLAFKFYFLFFLEKLQGTSASSLFLKII